LKLDKAFARASRGSAADGRAEKTFGMGQGKEVTGDAVISRRSFVLSTLPVGFAARRFGRSMGIQEQRPTMARIIVCDVNETLLDVQALEAHFARAFGDGRVLREWFSTVLLYSEVATLAGPYAEFRRDWAGPRWT
jgi:hypothetical protein